MCKIKFVVRITIKYVINLKKEFCDNLSRNNYGPNLARSNRDRKSREFTLLGFRYLPKIGIRCYSTRLASNISPIYKLINENGSFDILFVKSKKVKLGEAVIFNINPNTFTKSRKLCINHKLPFIL